MARTTRQTRTVRQVVTVTTIVVATAAAAILVWMHRETARSTQALLAAPQPFPAGILATGPKPGEVLQISRAVFSSEDPVFGPAFGNICVLLNPTLIPTSPKELLSAVHLSIDRLPVIELNVGDLIHGIVPRDGVFVAYPSEHVTGAVPFCLAMYLSPGSHQVEFALPQHSLEYSWAFRTTP